MLPNKRTSTHPGKILLHEFLEPLELSQSEFARHLSIPIQRVNELIKGKRGITPDTAWLLSTALGTTPEFWMNLQTSYELSSIEPPKGIKRLVA
ncbi:HigA family addiction module antitoxin [Granulosicoccus antarcticus]|uniref:Putative HTH-type transcriptional regulator YbaQ n=1 Tax=Granulosicoccus antarcticus IMCC3135 TaxID=1192854 RepID=A0A2Z2NZB3_9GAMM|nr:HigA family addiction module antitoxin [Granulosicoccus antarcticus]ASJ75765.1 putative HTH-type transcriptional regulator YbaQ [Granulosicoccus antarcticus IMCC3135]